MRTDSIQDHVERQFIFSQKPTAVSAYLYLINRSLPRFTLTSELPNLYKPTSTHPLITKMPSLPITTHLLQTLRPKTPDIYPTHLALTNLASTHNSLPILTAQADILSFFPRGSLASATDVSATQTSNEPSLEAVHLKLHLILKRKEENNAERDRDSEERERRGRRHRMNAFAEYELLRLAGWKEGGRAINRYLACCDDT